MNPKIREELISKIIEIEYEITTSIINGHRPYIGDCFESKRTELKLLRCFVFGYESPFCEKKLSK